MQIGASIPIEITSPAPAHISLSFPRAKVYHHPDCAAFNHFYSSLNGMISMRNCKISDDHYWGKIVQEWPRLISAYQEHGDKKPIMEYSLPDRTIYAWPANNYIDSLSLRNREDARNTYQRACLENKIMIFVKDVKNKTLKSYVTSI